MEWINVTKELPKKAGEFLTLSKLKKVTGGHSSIAIQMRFDPSSGWHSLISDERTAVTHWMSLPPLPKD